MSLLGLENRASRLHGRAELTILGLLGLLFCELLLFLTSETKGFINIHTHTLQVNESGATKSPWPRVRRLWRCDI